jgi:Fur family transcriptional regulator, ferric uptake regulator
VDRGESEVLVFPVWTWLSGPSYSAIMADAESTGVKQRFMAFLAHKNLRLTAQRRAIIDTAFSTRQHFTAEQLLGWSRRRDKSVSRATVYRTLPLLTESGMVREVDFGKDYKFYDPNYAERPYHNHIICTDCGKIFEFESESLEQLENDVSQRLGFSVIAQRLQISAHCEELRKHGVCKKRGD